MDYETQPQQTPGRRDASPGDAATTKGVVEALAVPLAPEDIRVGDYVAPTHDHDQYPLRGCDASFTGEDLPPRIHVVTVRTVCAYPRVMRVLAVALPLVLLEDAQGERSLDTVRYHGFARLPRELGQIAMRDLDRRRRKEASERRRAARARRERAEAERPGAEGAD
jgi:hypothetical protein